MRDLFSPLNHQGIKIDIYYLYLFQANKVRNTEIFKDLLGQLMKETHQKCKWEELALFS